MISVPRLYSVSDRMIIECGEAGEMRSDEGKIKVSGGKLSQFHYVFHKSQDN
jgi:hypothetical protein